MTPKIIELKQAPVVLVELPEGAICPSIGLSVLGYFFEGRIIIDSRIKGEYEVEGFLPDLTEEQFAKCVDVYEVSESINIPKMRFYQMLESEKVYTENPFGEEAQQRTIDSKRTVVLLKKNKSWEN